MNLAEDFEIFRAPALIAVAGRYDTFNLTDVSGRKRVVACARKDETVIPVEWFEVRVDVTALGTIDVHVAVAGDIDLATAVAVANPFYAIEARAISKRNLVDRTECDSVRVAYEVGAADTDSSRKPDSG